MTRAGVPAVLESPAGRTDREKSVPSRNDVFVGLMLACEEIGVSVGHRRLGRLVKRYCEDVAVQRLDYAAWLRRQFDPTGELAVERVEAGGRDVA